ncbi:hypothetical protein QQP08_023360 [Theobroma cacao]|nr:hypothetical protein QQP08_023360 [Theobroma cacao]
MRRQKLKAQVVDTSKPVRPHRILVSGSGYIRKVGRIPSQEEKRREREAKRRTTALRQYCEA